MTVTNNVFTVDSGMSKEIFLDKYSRKKDDGTYQSWEERIYEVIEGNFSLDTRNDPDIELDKQLAHYLGRKGILATSGRHLQHGDLDQKNKLGDYYINCFTSLFSFIQFLLLLKGGGVGRSYNSSVHFVDWDYMPNCRFVLSSAHPDYVPWIESLEEAKHKYDSESEDVRWFDVEDSAEGWVKVITIIETAAFNKNNKDSLFVFNTTPIRPKDTPIKGQQNRPASGPVPFIEALTKIMTIKGAGFKPWKQALFIDHYLAACVVLGGVRRSSRIGTKYWKDRDIFEYIDIKRGGWLYSANLSIGVDEEFWAKARDPKPSHGRRVFEAAISAAYWDNTGEPGFVNFDKVIWNNDGIEAITADNYIPEYYVEKLGGIHYQTKKMIHYILEKAKKEKYPFSLNPCVTADTWVFTSNGPKQVLDLIGKPFEAVVNGKKYKSKGFVKTDTDRQIYKVKTNRGYSLRVTDNHLISINTKEGIRDIAVSELEPGDKIVLNKSENIRWKGDGSYAEGWLMGSLLGDGYNCGTEKARNTLQYWGNSREFMHNYAREKLESLDSFEKRTNYGSAVLELDHDNARSLTSRYIDDIACNYMKGKVLEPCIEDTSSKFHKGFIRGIFDADGTVAVSKKKGNSVRLWSVTINHLEVVQRMLLRLGIASTIYQNRKKAGVYEMPDGNGGNKEYNCQAGHELVISRDNIKRYYDRVGFAEPEKQSKLEEIMENVQYWYKDRFETKIISIEEDGIEDVYDCSVEKIHHFDAQGMIVHNCAEHTLFIGGGNCDVGDVCVANADNKQEFLDGVGEMAKFLIRVNTMPLFYKEETARTNRIGVSLIGIHECAAKLFNYSFFDMIDEEKSMDWWKFIEQASLHVEKTSVEYSAKLGLVAPHTNTNLKPAGTVAKVFAVTEAANLLSMETYLRWIKFTQDNPMLEEFKRRGYPVKDVSKDEVRIDKNGKEYTVQGYSRTCVVGFPTKMPIVDLLGDRLVCAGDITLEQHYKWLSLLEKYWLRPGNGAQISYTMKYDPDKVSYNEFREAVLTYQPLIRCCAFSPQINEMAYIYTPEERISPAEYARLMEGIDKVEREAIDEHTLACANGSCGIELSKNTSIVDEDVSALQAAE